MNWDQIQGRWKQMQGDARRQWGQITDDELEEVQGDRNKLEGIIQERYGRSKEEARRELDDWAARH